MSDTNGQVSGPVESAPGIREVLLSGLGAVALLAVVGAPAAASWHGLVHFARADLALSGGWEYVVPISLDGAALYSATLALRAVLRGDSAIGARLLTCIYAVGAAAANAVAAATTPAALFFAAMSISAVVLWDATLRMARRDQLRALGVIEGPAARYRPLRWVLAPAETGRAWRTAVIEGVGDPATALAIARGQEPHPDPDGRPPGGGLRIECSERIAMSDDRQRAVLELESADSKADAVRAAFEALGARDVPAALELLDTHGVQVNRSYAYTVPWSPARPELRAVNGGGQ